ncbi:IQ calmodulin-binding motif-containing protein 1 [Rhinatrema bivittatum]|uniref:IQ calmodulin-binding motif-containing protein 1 n=1 Tax=Rhinatrema bivittatum TaxID=194408 RepID=UPI00112633EF|nr:IQ calmodulin-binding motif-containing protein 1 [Rhinatrema bivittatum]XP_029461067.1 IQ calmodulin-binding motif-containing protein 1 [Rhinatrema bivittatum]
MSQMKTGNVDARILSLASEVTEISNQNVPVLLLELKEILKSAPSVSKESTKLKEDLYHYDLIQYCVLVLKQDYSRVNGGWATAAKLAEILSNCCVGLNPKEDVEEFYNKVLPSAIDNLLFLGRRLQARFIRAIKDEEKSEFVNSFRTVTDSVCWLSGGHIQLTVCVLQSDHFLQLLMTDDVETGTTVMSMLQNILRVNSSVLSQIHGNSLHSILDELVYKLSSATNPVIGNAATKSLLLMVESHRPLVQLLDMRYRGLRALLSKQWTGKGFGRELGRLLDLLCSGSYRQVEMQRLHHAACLIQAVWKGFWTRKRLKKLPKAVTSLQRGFRAKREQELLHLKRQKEEEDLKQQLQLERRRAMRAFREKQLTLLEIVHAGQVDRHMQEMQEKSALTIQRHWRGHKERKSFHQQRRALKQYKAAVTIQRAALRFLKIRRRIREALSPWKGPRELTDARRLELQEKIDDYVKLHPASQLSEEKSKELHVCAQETLGQYLLKRRLQQKAELRREALLAQVNTDIKMLMSAPNLKEVTEKHLEVFTSRSVPVAAKAKQCHNTMLKYTRWPWWKKLGEEFMDDEVVPKELPAVEYGTLYIGGSKPS